MTAAREKKGKREVAEFKKKKKRQSSRWSDGEFDKQKIKKKAETYRDKM